MLCQILDTVFLFVADFETKIGKNVPMTSIMVANDKLLLIQLIAILNLKYVLKFNFKHCYS